MHLRRLELTHYRCYRQLELALPPGTVVVAGGNAAGKSSLLESLFVLATTRAPYGATDRQWFGWDALASAAPFSRLAGEVVRKDGLHVVEVIQARLGDRGEERFVKRVRVDGLPRRAMEAIGSLQVVLFTPRDLRIVDGAPSDRRRYLDVLLCQVDRAYCQALGQYSRVLAQRNHLLRRLRTRGGDREELAFWESKLAEHGGQLIATRASTVAALGHMARRAHCRLAGAAEVLGMAYRSSLVGTSGGSTADVSGPASAQDAQEVSRTLAWQLAGHRDEELRRGMTLVGPHRDDIVLTVSGADLRAYGSRGQQRTAALALKIAEAQLMARRAGEAPVLLLDDVLSELDLDRRRQLLACLEPVEQVLLTTTDLAILPAEFLEGSAVLSVAGGHAELLSAAGEVAPKS